MIRHDETFACMGTRVRVLIEDPARDPAPAGGWARRYLEDAAARLTRFEPTSELSALNAAPGRRHPARPLLRSAIAAALWAAESSGGLVDPTLGAAMIRAGYGTSRTGVAAAPLAWALEAAPSRAAARPDRHSCWRSVRVEDDAIVRPAGVVLDTGGTTKGLLADAVANHLRGFARVVVDCGGDMRIGGTAAEPRTVLVEHPISREHHLSLDVLDGAVATSGIGNRVWRDDRGGYAHHLLDPATGEPAWTGLVAVTATAPSALEAEVVAKAALLSGADGARRRLAEHGGILVLDDGQAEHVHPAPLPTALAA